jgi:phosphoribosylformylglycinamidine cyclo-ligase
MYNTYNMGVGMCVMVAKEDVTTALEILRANGDDAYVLGEIVESDEQVILE